MRESRARGLAGVLGVALTLGLAGAPHPAAAAVRQDSGHETVSPAHRPNQRAISHAALSSEHPPASEAERPPVSVRDLVAFRRLIDRARISPDGTAVAYAVAEADLDRNAAEIVIYVGTLPAVTDGRIGDRPFEPRSILKVRSFQDLRWSTDGKGLFILHQPAGEPRPVITRVDAGSGRVLHVLSSKMTIEHFEVTGERSDVSATGYLPPTTPIADDRGVVVPPGDQNPLWLARIAQRDARRETHLFAGGEEHFVRFAKGGSEEPARPERSRLDRHGDIEVGISESIHAAPELQMGIVSNDASRRLTNLNPLLAARKLGQVELMEWSISGRRYWGHIIYPVDYKPGTRYPCAILSKSWTKDGFYFESQSTYPYGNFPAQTLAGSNILVLMLARGDIPHGDVDTFDARGAREGYGSARDELARRGLVDPARCGLMGFSHTGWQIDYLISHPGDGPPWAAAISVDHYTRDYATGSVGRFSRDASMGPADRRIPALWIPYVGQVATEQVSRFHTVDDVRSAYLQRSAAWNASAIRTPLLEVAHESPDYASEMLNAMSIRGKPAELIWMPGGSHTLETPLQRYWSMQRTVDWFRFWLQDYERPNVPEDPERYIRWRKLRDLHRQNERWIAEGKDPNEEWWKSMRPVSALADSVRW